MAAEPRPPLIFPPSSYHVDWQYRCTRCGSRLVADTAEVLRHVDTRMPVCCGLVMELTALGEPPGKAGP